MAHVLWRRHHFIKWECRPWIKDFLSWPPGLAIFYVLSHTQTHTRTRTIQNMYIYNLSMKESLVVPSL